MGVIAYLRYGGIDIIKRDARKSRAGVRVHRHHWRRREGEEAHHCREDPQTRASCRPKTHQKGP
jgi:hypothetical protein